MNFRFSLPFVYLLSLLQFLIVSADCQRLNGDSLKSLVRNKEDTTELRILNQLSERYRSDSSKSIFYGRKALSLASRLDNTTHVIIALKNIGIAYGFKNNYPKAIEYLLQSSELAERYGYKKQAASNYTNVGSAYAVSSNYEKQLSYYLKALKLYEELGDKRGVATITYGIGNVYTYTQQYELALENFKKALAYFLELKDYKELGKIYVNMGALFYKKDELDKSLSFYQKAYQLFKDADVPRGMAAALIPQGEILIKTQKFVPAQVALEEALHLAERSNHQLVMATSLLLLGKIAIENKKLDLALDYFNQARRLEKATGNKEELSTLYLQLSVVYKLKGDYKKALEFHTLYKSIYDSVSSVEKSTQLQELQVKYESEKKAKEIQVLKSKNIVERIYFIGAFVAFLVIVIIGALILHGQKQKIIKNKELSEKENQLLEERSALAEVELLNQKLVEEKLRDQIEFKNKELTTYTLNLIQKNESLEKIKEGVTDLQNSPDEQLRPKLNGLLNTVNYSLHLDKAWDNFRIHFEQVHQNFFEKLRLIAPDLGSNDMKLCALVKLNLDIKETATILDISPESVKVARYRLRKKLNLSTEQNLAAYLISL